MTNDYKKGLHFNGRGSSASPATDFEWQGGVRNLCSAQDFGTLLTLRVTVMDQKLQKPN